MPRLFVGLEIQELLRLRLAAVKGPLPGARWIDPDDMHVTPRFSRVSLHFGFTETPNVPRALGIARKLGWSFDIMSTSFFLSRRSLKPAAHSGMPIWQDRLFIALAKGASDATDFFQIPTGRVVEIGTQVTI